MSVHQSSFASWSENPQDQTKLDACLDQLLCSVSISCVDPLRSDSHALLMLFGKCLVSRSILEQSVQDIDQGLEQFHFGLCNIPDLSYQGCHSIMQDIACALLARWDMLHQLDDLNLAIYFAETIIKQQKYSHPQSLRIAVLAIFTRFAYFPQLSDLESCISVYEALLLQRNSFNIKTSSEEDFSDYYMLGHLFLIKWVYNPNQDVLKQSIQCFQSALALHDISPASRALGLIGLSEATQSNKLVTDSTLVECLERNKLAVSLVSSDQIVYPLALAALAFNLIASYIVSGNESEWDSYLECCMKFKKLSYHFNIPIIYLYDSAWAVSQQLGAYHGRHGVLAGLFVQKLHTRLAITYSEPLDDEQLIVPHTFKPCFPDSFDDGVSLMSFRIKLHRLSKEAQQADGRALYIGELLRYCFGRTTSEDPLGRLLQPLGTLKDVLDLWEKHLPGPDRWLYAKYVILTDQLDDVLDEINGDDDSERIEVLQHAVHYRKLAVDSATKWGYSTLPLAIMELLQSWIVLAFYDPTVRHSLLNAAIEYASKPFLHSGPSEPQSEEANETQETDGAWETRIPKLAEALCSRYYFYKDPKDLERAFLTLKAAALDHTRSVSSRHSMAEKWAFLARDHNDSSVVDAFILCVELLASLAVTGTVTLRSIDCISEDSMGMAGTLQYATQYCIEYGRLEDALKVMQRGQGTVWKRLIHFQSHKKEKSRSDDNAILNVVRGLADVERRNTPWIWQDGHSEGVDIEVTLRSLRERRLMHDLEKWDPNFSSSVAAGAPVSTKISDLVPFVDSIPAGCFPLVVLNKGMFTCDALIIRHRQSGIELVRLPMCTPKYLKTLVHQLQGIIEGKTMRAPMAEETRRLGIKSNDHKKVSLFNVLGDIWTCIVKPVLITLNFQEKHNTDLPPRVWWHPTGEFWQLPIHAAGIYSNSECLSIHDYTVSSYLPPFSIDKALTASHTQPHDPHLLAVYHTHTDKLNFLPAVVNETQEIESVLNSFGIPVTMLGDITATQEAILKLLPTTNIVHFALHGFQDPSTPFESCLYLSSTSDKLTIAELLEMDLPHAELAFLSACQTAMGHMDPEHDITDEVVHMSASMLFAGFKGVVGTMWSIVDCDGPVVAKEFYTHLFKDGTFDVCNAAYALHMAVGRLRAEGVSPLRWAPFIHVGL
ncbi:hypothetical protein BT96DRAFT_866757 [Gymnopus androsaceus JB14]|uniref:CHAT domain-containing protein n=1 Tax=Gymnopus androsaceus JB14 TaxID=1447944 RepID=A0A6A4GTV4_9AGAR|nr:hypothetical protein BT96DRAFT_866757 [Gymnopus androsaceus JB14]